MGQLVPLQLGRLLRPEHGETLQSAAMLMQRLAPSLLGLVVGALHKGHAVDP
jgi:hypothetical protein